MRHKQQLCTLLNQESVCRSLQSSILVLSLLYIRIYYGSTWSFVVVNSGVLLNAARLHTPALDDADADADTDSLSTSTSQGMHPGCS
jgi:hypothetical protein